MQLVYRGIKMSGNIIIGKGKVQISASNLYLGDPFHNSYNPRVEKFTSEEVKLNMQQSESDGNLEVMSTSEFKKIVERLQKQACDAGLRADAKVTIIDFKADVRPVTRSRSRCSIM